MDKSVISERGVNMIIFPADKNLVIITTPQGNIHVCEQTDGTTSVYYHDHLHMVISGKHKQVPTVTIDSDEYPTNLVIQNSESQWYKFSKWVFDKRLAK